MDASLTRSGGKLAWPRTGTRRESGSLCVGEQMAVITGTDSGENLAGTSGDDEICALGGNDTIALSGGVDTVDGGDGDDRLTGGPAPFLISRSYLITANHISLAGVFDTTFANVERIQIFETTPGEVTLDASGFAGTALTVTVGLGYHTLTGGAAADTFIIQGG